MSCLSPFSTRRNCACGYSNCRARFSCTNAGTAFCQCCNGIPLITSTAIAFNSGTGSAYTTVTTPALDLPGDRFILDVVQTIEANDTQPIEISEGTTPTILAMYDRHGNFVRTDALLATINARKARVRPWCNGSTTRFRAVLGSDPARINILDCLLTSTYVPTVAVAENIVPSAQAASLSLDEPTSKAKKS